MAVRRSFWGAIEHGSLPIVLTVSGILFHDTVVGGRIDQALLVEGRNQFDSLGDCIFLIHM